jgi:uncharacterized protein YdaU (DUF1376 family)
MMVNDRLPWFPCEPGPLLGALACMRAPKQLVYMVMLLRIYESGGACADSLDAIATRTRLNKRVVTDALDELFREGRLFRGEGGIHNPKADQIVAGSIALFKKRKRASTEAANSRWGKHKRNQQTDDAIRNADAMQIDTHLHLHKQEQEQEEREERQDSLFSNEKRTPPSDWPDDFRERFWEAYPRKTEKKSAMAKLEAIRKSGSVPWAKFIDGISRYRDHVVGSEERYIKHPTTWLNKGCWDDEHLQQKPASENRSNPAANATPTRDSAIIAGMGRALQRRREARIANGSGSSDVCGHPCASGGIDADNGATSGDDRACQQLTVLPATNGRPVR